jgi:hypothetical protein
VIAQKEAEDLTKAIIRGIGPVIKQFVEQALAPLLARIDVLEHREAAADKRLARL